MPTETFRKRKPQILVVGNMEDANKESTRFFKRKPRTTVETVQEALALRDMGESVILFNEEIYLLLSQDKERHELTFSILK